MSRYHLNSARLSVVLLCLWFGMGQVLATSMLLTGAGSSGGAAAPPPTLSFVSTLQVTASGSTLTTAVANIGNPSYIGTRRVICVLSRPARENPSIVAASTTINSVPVTVHVDEEQNNTTAAIFSAVVTSGTTNVTITITFAGAQFTQGMLAIYNVDNSLLNSTTPTTGLNTGTALTSLATAASIATSAGGFIVGSLSQNTATSAQSISGYTIDASFGNKEFSFSAGSLAGGNVTPTATWTTSSSASIAAAAWR